MNLNKLREYYHNNLLNEIDEGENIELLNFIKSRKISMGMIHKFKYGYSPDTWDIKHIEGIYHRNLIDTVGLISKKNDKEFPFFRNRFMFPINDSKRDCLGFSGRRIDSNSKMKFINSKESILYRKSEILYGHDPEAILNNDYVIIVEGNLDCDRMKANGFWNTVSPCGTSLTENQIKRLYSLTKNFVIIFDGDSAGRKASERVAELFSELKIKEKPRFVFMPESIDPDLFLLNNTYDDMINLINSGKNIKVKKKEKIINKVDYKELDNIDIVSVINNYIILNKRGSNYLGLCPFHHEKNPSLTVNRDKNVWKCFSCGESGKGAISFVMRYLDIDFKEALKIING